MKKYETIENFSIGSGVHIPSDFKYKNAREIFYKNYDQHNTKDIVIGFFDTNRLIEYLNTERKINPFLINGIINKYNKTF